MDKIYIFLIIILISGCSGKEVTDTDTIPPLKPHLIPHQGDTGDVVGSDTLNFYNNSEFENNGIDAVPGGDYIKIQWEVLLDSDIDYLVIYRFSLGDYQNEIEPTKVDSIDAPIQTDYIDEIPNYFAPIDKSWFYYMKVFDTAGNSAVSDTVCYKLLGKPLLSEPQYGEVFDDVDDVVFEWSQYGSIPVVSYTLLVFDENYNLVWSFVPASDEGFIDLSIPYAGPEIINRTLRWRVDVKGQTFNEYVNEIEYTISAGSESYERVIVIE